MKSTCNRPRQPRRRILAEVFWFYIIYLSNATKKEEAHYSLKSFVLQQAMGRRRPKTVSADFICGHVQEEILKTVCWTALPLLLFPPQIMNTKTRFTTGAQNSSTNIRGRRKEFNWLYFHILSVIDFFFTQFKLDTCLMHVFVVSLDCIPLSVHLLAVVVSHIKIFTHKKDQEAVCLWVAWDKSVL